MQGCWAGSRVALFSTLLRRTSPVQAVVDLVKEYNKLNRNGVAIMLDTKGPEVRSGDVTEPITMKPGGPVHLNPLYGLWSGISALVKMGGGGNWQVLHSSFPGL